MYSNSIRRFYRSLSNHKLKNCFLITPGGCAATKWLASCLCIHPEILCSGGAGDLKITLDFSHKSTPEESEEVAKFLIFHQADKNPKIKHFYEIFDELKRYKQACFYGNRHFFTIESLCNQLKFDSLPKNFPIANIVRHPITRLETHYQHWQRSYQSGSNCANLFELCLSGFEVRYRSLKEEFLNLVLNLDNNYKKRVFMYSIFDTLSCFFGDFRTAINRNIPNYRMEDLKTIPEKMIELIKFITQGEICPDHKVIKKIYSTASMEIGRFSGRTILSELEQYQVWEKWQQDMFKVRNLRCLQRRQGRWGVQRGAMQCSPLVAVRAGFPRRRNQLRKQSRPLAAELLKKAIEYSDMNMEVTLQKLGYQFNL